MTKQLTINLDAELIQRTERLAAKRGISVDQLISQQLERSVAHDEYNELKQQVAAPRAALRKPKPAQRALKRARTNSANTDELLRRG
jgi:predicted transcriptional regulator